MSDGSPRRRRWLTWIMSVGILLGVAPLAWRYRPLSQTERKLVGTWRIGSEPERSRLTLTRGRRISAVTDKVDRSGNWYASDGKLYVSYDLPFPEDWSEVLQYLQQRFSQGRGLHSGPIDLKFEGTMRVRLRYQPLPQIEEEDDLLERVP